MEKEDDVNATWGYIGIVPALDPDIKNMHLKVQQQGRKICQLKSNVKGIEKSRALWEATAKHLTEENIRTYSELTAFRNGDRHRVHGACEISAYSRNGGVIYWGIGLIIGYILGFLIGCIYG